MHNAYFTDTIMKEKGGLFMKFGKLAGWIMGGTILGGLAITGGFHLVKKFKAKSKQLKEIDQKK